MTIAWLRGIRIPADPIQKRHLTVKSREIKTSRTVTLGLNRFEKANLLAPLSLLIATPGKGSKNELGVWISVPRLCSARENPWQQLDICPEASAYVEFKSSLHFRFDAIADSVSSKRYTLSFLLLFACVPISLPDVMSGSVSHCSQIRILESHRAS